jgi:hypothetical protein
MLLCGAGTLSLAGCMTSAPFRPESAVTVSEAELAIVELQWVDSIARGEQLMYSYPHGQRAGWREIPLSPGAYTITYRIGGGPAGPGAERKDHIDLIPSHRYRVGQGQCTWWSPEHGCSFAWAMLWQSNEYVRYLWIEDVTTGQVVSGSKTEPAPFAQ